MFFNLLDIICDWAETGYVYQVIQEDDSQVVYLVPKKDGAVSKAVADGPVPRYLCNRQTIVREVVVDGYVSLCWAMIELLSLRIE